ncbi:MAG: hypothetical protein K8T89_24320 [Planctomycetes bacterium]|nr:hypothetical protein [Planctomycetota bacterium]
MPLKHILIVTSFLQTTILLAAPPQGYTAKVSVTSPTRLDWTFTSANQSLTTLPKGFLDEKYDSTKQSYELFLPPSKDKKPLPAILFVSAGDEPQGWKSFEGPCKALGFVFIGVRGAGNGVDFPKRCRIILDCLDDVRRQVPLDPDRTYVSGLSGGGRMACALGFALPEYFGGMMPIVAGGEMRDEPWLRHRAIDRLSIALLTGQTDFNRGEVEQYKGPLWKEIGINAKVWVQPNHGHGMPSAATLTEAIKFLDEGKEKRAALAKKYPATRASADGAASREDAAKLLLYEGKEKLKTKETTFAGLMLLKGAMERWPDLAAAKEARKILLEYEDKKVKPWEADDIAEQARYLLAEARHLSDYALLGIPPKSTYEKHRPEMAQKAIELWEKVIASTSDAETAKEAKKRIPELEKLAPKK